MILITGGTGLVGAHLIYQLLKDSVELKAIHRKNSDLLAVKNVFSYYTSPQEAEVLFKKINWVEADILDLPALYNAFQNITQVYHCAALISFDPGDFKKMRKINIEGTANVVNLCIEHKIEKLCHISSIASLSLNPGKKHVTEDFTWNPEEYHNDYAISKYGAEIEVWRASQEGVPVIILNPGIIIGPGFWDSGSGRIFKKVSNGLDYYFPKVTGFIGVWDVVNLAVAGMDSTVKNEQFIAVSENISFTQLFNEVAQSVNTKSPSKQLQPWMIRIAWFFQFLGRKLFNFKQQVNKKDATNLFTETYFSNKKAQEQLNFHFSSISEDVKRTGKLYLKDHK